MPCLSPLVIAEVATPSGAVFGLSHCPGRCTGSDGPRVLAEDLAAIEAWGAHIMLSLVEAGEFARLGVPDLPTAVRQQTFQWLHVPIPDFSPPTAESLAAWTVAAPIVAAALDEGQKIHVHCAAGIGRTGTIVAKLLVEMGVPPADAM